MVPLLGAPMFGGKSETLLQQAISAAASRGLVHAHQHVVNLLHQPLRPVYERSCQSMHPTFTWLLNWIVIVNFVCR